MKIAVVDDHPLVRAGLCAVFSTEPDIELVGEAAHVDEAIQMILEKRPDVALVDLRLGRESGLAVIQTCKTQVATCRYIILTSSADRADFTRAVEEGVDGYALKEALPEELLYAMKIVFKGRKYYDPIFLEEAPVIDTETYEHLTPKENEVLRALGRGLSNREIAQELFVTEYTVKKHVSQILAKLGLSDRTQAALWANSKGLVTFQ